MPALVRLAVAGLLGLALAFLVACGDRNGLIPRSRADAVERQLDSVSSAVDDHACARASAAAVRAQQEAARLPATVDARLRARLDEGLQRLPSLSARDCLRETTTTETTTTTTETTPTATETTPTDTTPTTPTSTTPTTETTPTTPPTTTGPTGGTPGAGGDEG